MIRHDCFHLKRVTNNDIHEGNRGTLRCDVNRAAPDASVAGISCPEECMGYRKIQYKASNGKSALGSLKEKILSLMGKG